MLETTGTSRSSAIAPLVGCGWTFTPHPPTSLFSPVGFGSFGGPVAVNVTPLNGGYHYLDPCDDPALLTSHSGVWRPFVRLTDTGYILLAMPVAALEPSVRSALVDALLGSLDVPALAAVSGELHLERTDIAGELLVDDAVADALDSEIERVRTNGGTLTERYTLTVHCEYHEGTPLRNIDLRVTADGDELYATEGFGGADPSPDGDGNVTLAVPSSVHRDDGVRTLRVILESSSNWEHAGPLSLDGPTTVVLRSPDPSPRPVALRCELDGTDALLTWDLSRDIDFDHYLLEVDGPEGLTFNIIDGGERIVSLHDGSTYNVSIRVVDADGYRSMPTRIVVVTPNLPPPAPADLAAVAIDGSRLEVTWGRIAVPDLDHFTIAYTDLLVDIGSRGLADAALDTVDLPPDATSAVLEGLREGTTYRLLVAAVDVHGAVGRSAEVTVSMPVTPPQIHVVDPTPGGPVNDVVRLSGTASDDRLLVSVEYRVDDGEWRPAVGRDRWALIMSVGDLEEGHHDLQIKARDVSSNATISLPLEISHADDGRTGEVPVPTAYYALLSVATALVVLLLTESGLYLVFSALGLLYARITGRRVLDNYIRGKIHGYIIANPGDHYSSIMRKLGLSNGLFAYHVKVLERESLVKSVMDGRLRRFYPVGMKVVFERELDMLQVRILNIISENPGITQKEIASALGMRKQVVNLNVRAMYHEGLIDIVRSGRETHLYLISPEDARGSGDGASGEPPG
ncbi:MAG TPA: winged helix-turn-helix transcriptional regulator [Thermoplasmata archaeon]|nr:winged helix-turn-helix transcriptional regulator [Thermoplasmata archaeon]